jgi:hypothetical protein
MRCIHKGHAIEVTREPAPRNGACIRTQVVRLSDGYECLSSCVEMAARQAPFVKDEVKELKARVDFEIGCDDPWGEKAKEYPPGYMQGRGAA